MSSIASTIPSWSLQPNATIESAVPLNGAGFLQPGGHLVASSGVTGELCVIRGSRVSRFSNYSLNSVEFTN